MTLQFNRYVFGLALNTVFILALLIYTWKLKKTPGARYFAYALFACLIWDFASVFELSSIDLSAKILFAKISFLGTVCVANFWFFLAVASSQKYKSIKAFNLVWVVPVIMLIIAWTNDFHKLIWADVSLSGSPYGIIAIYKHGALFYLNVGYSYVILAVGAILLIKEAIDFPKGYRTQSFVLIIAICIPRFGDALYYIGSGPLKGFNPEMIFFTISAFLIVFGYLKLNLLNITPIAQELIFSNLAEGILVTDTNNFLIEVNHSAMGIFNNELRQGENIQGALTKYFPELLINQLDKEQELFSIINNVETWLEFKISQVKNFNGDLLGKVYMFRDITQRKLAEEALKESEKHLLELNEIKNRFFSILSHDLRSPFSGLIGFVEILKEDFSSLPELEKEDFINEIDLTTKNIYAFLEDLLEWSRLNMSSFKAQIQILKLYDEVEEVFNLLTYNARRKGVRLVNELNKLDCAVGDSAMVKLLLRNLVSNAIKFSSKNDIVRIYSKTNNTNTEISIADTGTGIPAEALPKLFRLDVKYSTPGSNAETGSGIGLVLCKEILDKLGGKILVESELGKGSTFTFSLPHQQLQNS
jgi:PAS domain S-box-containing protein